MFNVVIIGGEDCGNYEFFKQKVIQLTKEKARTEGMTIYTTGDEYVKQLSQKYYIDTYFIECDWNTYGKDALKKRNERLLSDADALIYFDTNKKDFNIIYEIAKSKNIPCRRIAIDH